MNFDTKYNLQKLTLGYKQKLGFCFLSEHSHFTLFSFITILLVVF